MPLDPNILLQRTTPDVMSALSRGIQAGQSLRQAPILEAMQRQKIEQGKAQQQQQQQTLSRQRIGQVAGLATQAKAIPTLAGRQEFVNQNAEALASIGIDINQIGGLDDASLDRIIGLNNAVNPKVTDPRLALQQRTLDIREKEHEGRLALAQGEAERAGKKKAAQLEAERGIKAEIAGEVASSQVRSKEVEQRGQEIIAKGQTAADGTAVLRRGMQLLNAIETGGMDRAQLAAKNFFGIESADEGELSNLLGKAVLSQLKETFGAAFTAQEGQSLKAIDANMGKSPAANKRLLKNALRIAERSALRGIDRAVEAKDFKTAQEIQESLDFVLDGLEAVPQQPQQQAAPQPQAAGGIKFLGFE